MTKQLATSSKPVTPTLPRPTVYVDRNGTATDDLVTLWATHLNKLITRMDIITPDRKRRFRRCVNYAAATVCKGLPRSHARSYVQNLMLMRLEWRMAMVGASIRAINEADMQDEQGSTVADAGFEQVMAGAINQINAEDAEQNRADWEVAEKAVHDMLVDEITLHAGPKGDGPMDGAFLLVTPDELRRLLETGVVVPEPYVGQDQVIEADRQVG